MDKSLAILAHAVRMLIFETGMTVKVVLPALVVIFGSALCAALLAPGAIVTLQSRPDEMAFPDPGQVFLVLGIGCIGLLGYALMAILWHRHVLRNGVDGQQVSTLGSGLFLSYIGKAIVVALVQLIASVPITLAMAVLGGLLVPLIGGLAVVVVGIIGGLAFVWIALRISLVLPAAAVGSTMKIRESWEATAPMSGAIWGVAALLAGLNMCIFGLTGNLLPDTGGVALLAHTFIYVVEGIVFISVLTTLYGTLIEGRSLG